MWATLAALRYRSWGMTLNKTIRSVVPFFLAVFLLLDQAHADDPGDVSWFDLITEDETVAGTFYAGLFGWEVVSDASGDKMFSYKGTPIAQYLTTSRTSTNLSGFRLLSLTTYPGPHRQPCVRVARLSIRSRASPDG